MCNMAVILSYVTVINDNEITVTWLKSIKWFILACYKVNLLSSDVMWFSHDYSVLWQYNTSYVSKMSLFKGLCALKPLGGLVVKTLACCAGGTGFDPRVENLKFSKDLHQQNPRWMSFGWDVKLAAPCTSVYAGQVKDPTHGPLFYS